MAIGSYKWRSRVISGDRGLEVAIESYNLPTRVLSRNREIKNLYCYLLTWIESKSNRKLLSGNEKYRDVPYGPPYTIPFGIACTFSDNLSRNSCLFTGLSLTARDRGFLLATMSVAPGYFSWKIEGK